MALHRHTHAFGLPPVVQAADNIQIPPSSAEKRTGGRAAETHQKAACTWFFNVQAAFFRFSA